jgi:hypothetical protein
VVVAVLCCQLVCVGFHLVPLALLALHCAGRLVQRMTELCH